MEPTFNQEEVTQASDLRSEIERNEGTPSWDQTETPEEVEGDETPAAGEESPETLQEPSEEQEEEEVIWNDDETEDETSEETSGEEEQKTPQVESPRRVLGFADYFNRAQ